MRKIIKDDFGNDFIIEDLKKFKNHLTAFHTIGGKADNSVHEENGRYFTITEEFYNKILHLS